MNLLLHETLTFIILTELCVSELYVSYNYLYMYTNLNF